MCPSEDTALTQMTRLTNDLLHTNKTVAVLTKTEYQANKLYASLRADHPVTLMSDRDRSIPNGILILPIYLAKGLEFDAVIGYDVSKSSYHEAGDRDILYTLASRAMHDLQLVGIKAPSPILEEIPQDLFDYYQVTEAQELIAKSVE
ncbi:DNA helicase [Agrilactobacillus composti DSM 18527 = JCM 14202]|nr:DNA helicase [Agrilactobacillus composti DSM 18527 = JCM 14202]